MRASFACTHLASSRPTRRRHNLPYPGFGSNCSQHRALLHHCRDPAARQRLGVNTRTQGLHEHLLPLSPSPASDTRSTRMTVTARPAHLPQDRTHGRPAAAPARRPSRPTGSQAAALPPGLKDVSSRSPRSPAASWALAEREPRRPPTPQPLAGGSPESARSPPDLNGGHQAGPAAVSSQRSLGRKERRLRTLRAARRPPISKDRPIVQPIAGQLLGLTAYVTNGLPNNRPQLAPGRRTGTAPSLTTAEPTNSWSSPSIAAFPLVPEPWGRRRGRRPRGR